MRFRMTFWRVALLLAFLTLLFGISFTQVSSAATGGDGYVRLGNLSETLSPVDIYLVPSDGGKTIVKSNLSYGTVLIPLTIPAGPYTVDVRDAGASPASPPVVSAKITVQPGRFYTVANAEVSGEGNQRELVDLPDAASTPAGDASVQAIDAAYQNGTITFHCSYTSDPDDNVLTKAHGGVADSDDMPAGTWTATVTAADGKKTSEPLKLTADTDRTEIVLDTSSGLQVLNLLDVVGVDQKPTGFITGLAPVPGSPLPWLVLIGAGGFLVVGGGLGLSRAGLRRRGSQV
jgi:hypothetical protein